jgi:hypothetical protein
VRSRVLALSSTHGDLAYADGIRFDYSVCTTPFLYSSPITDRRVLAPYLASTDDLFFEP